MGIQNLSKGTLANLNAYFVLQNAEKEYNFKVQDVEGLTQEDAITAAGESVHYLNGESKLLSCLQHFLVVLLHTKTMLALVC